MGSRKFIATFSVVALFLAVLSWQFWPSDFLTWLCFNSAFILMVVLSFFGPASYVYSFLALFLFLGFWGKLNFHLAFSSQFIEPIGLFDGSSTAWDSVIRAATVAAAAVVTARLGQIFFTGRKVVQAPFTPPIPLFYLQWRIPLWIGSVSLLLLLHAWNQYAFFYQIGVNPRLLLPMHLNVLMGWLISWGFAFAFALLAYWELLRSNRKSFLILAVLLFEAIVTGVSTLSRAAYLFQGFSFCLPWVNYGFEKNKVRNFFLVAAFFLGGLVISLVSVQLLRAERYLAPPSVEVSSSYKESIPQSPPQSRPWTEQRVENIHHSFLQIPYLFLNRWVGLEALMAVSAYPEKGWKTMWQAFSDDPRLGVDSLFQRVANASYSKSQQFTFLTLAGPIALFSFSGSLLVVAVGMLLLTCVLLSIEAVMRRWLCNPFVVCLGGVAMAYTVFQATFPYLTLVFFLELFATTSLIFIMQRRPASSSLRYE